jgi:hypothetical protein
VDRIRILAVATVLAASSAGAQFTPTLSSQKKTDKQNQAAAQQTAQLQKDSVQRLAIVDMKTWVDSAASSLGAGVDSLQDTTRRPVSSDTTRRVSAGSLVDSTTKTDSIRLKNGAPAPATATPLPTVALVGAGLVVLGLALRRRQRA